MEVDATSERRPEGDTKRQPIVLMDSSESGREQKPQQPQADDNKEVEEEESPQDQTITNGASPRPSSPSNNQQEDDNSQQQQNMMEAGPQDTHLDDNEQEGEHEPQQTATDNPTLSLRDAVWPHCAPHPDESYIFCIIQSGPYTCKWAMLERDDNQWAVTTVWRTEIIEAPRLKHGQNYNEKEHEDTSTTTASSVMTPCRQLCHYVPPFLIERLFADSDYTSTSAQIRRLRELLPNIRVYLLTDETTKAAQNLGWAFSEIPSLLYQLPYSQVVPNESSNSNDVSFQFEYSLVRSKAKQLADGRPLLLLESSMTLTLEYIQPNNEQESPIVYQTLSMIGKVRALFDHTGKLPTVRMQDLLQLSCSTKERRPLNYSNTQSNMAASIFGETSLYVELCLLEILEHHWASNETSSDKRLPLLIMAGIEARLLWNLLFEHSRLRTLRVDWQPSEEKDSLLLVLQAPYHEKPYYLECVILPHLVFDTMKDLLHSHVLPSSSLQTLRNAITGCRIAKFFDLKVLRGYVSYIDTSNKESETIENDLFIIRYDDDDAEDLNAVELYDGLVLYVNEFESGDAPEMEPKRQQSKQAADLLLQSCQAVQEHVKQLEQQSSSKKKLHKNQ